MNAEVDLERGANRVDAIPNGGHVPIMSMSELIVAEDAAEQAQSAPAAPPARRKPVKGLCRWCGKNWSRHYVVFGENGSVRYCTGAATQKFECAPADAPEAAPAPPATAGGITEAQSKQLAYLAGMWFKAEKDRLELEAQLSCVTDNCATYAREFHHLLDSLTVRP